MRKTKHDLATKQELGKILKYEEQRLPITKKFNLHFGNFDYAENYLKSIGFNLDQKICDYQNGFTLFNDFNKIFANN